jgi:hypothetical protein
MMEIAEALKGECRLCGSVDFLVESHIIPKFVSRWLKDSSVTGYLRYSLKPNVRRQDGIKLPLLCLNCEGLLGKWETKVANEIFHPINHSQPRVVRYQGEWLLKFAVSVSWRSLTYWMDSVKGSLHSSEESLALINKCLHTWKEFLFDRRADPGAYEQHMVLFDPIASMQNLDHLPSNMNRFLIRGLHSNIAISDGRPAFIFTKMGRMALFGFISIQHPRRWIGTKIHIKCGQLRGDIELPSQILDYLIERALKEREAYQQVSVKQKEKIAATYSRRNPDRITASETFQAMDHDVRLFGKRAFSTDEEGEE